MDLTLNEAIPNIIEYAFQNGELSVININLVQDRRGYLLEIIDKGIPFNPFAKTFNRAMTLDAATVNGRGIHLIKQFSDKQMYLRDKDRNILTLSFIMR